MNIKTVTVVGSNGAMGCNISGIFASLVMQSIHGKSYIEESKKRIKAAASVKAGSIIIISSR